MTRRKVRWLAGVAVVGGLIAAGAGLSYADVPLSSGSEDGSTSTGTGAGVPGVLTVSEATASPGHGQYSAVSVAGQPVLGYDQNGAIGPVAPLAGLVDTVNGVTCNPNGGPLAAQGYAICLQLLANHTFAGNVHAALAELTVIQSDENGPQSFRAVDVLPTNAFDSGCGRAALVDIVQLDANGYQETPIGMAKSPGCP